MDFVSCSASISFSLMCPGALVVWPVFLYHRIPRLAARILAASLQ
jgi:hypothetical protein